MISRTVSLSMRFLRRYIFAAVAAVFVPAAVVHAGDIPDDLMVDLDSLTVSETEFVCLALNDYFEARGESLAGRLAVAKVVINRAMDRRYPANICDVIQQNKARVMHRCQFSWYCDGKSDKIPDGDNEAWDMARLAAFGTYFGKTNDLVDGSLWYHADYVTPGWAEVKTVKATIGDHIFYGWNHGVSE